MVECLRRLISGIFHHPIAALLVVALLACIATFSVVAVAYARVEYHYQAAQSALDRGEFNTARQHLTYCLDARPDSAETQFLAARAARGALDYREADRRLRQYQRLGGLRELIDLERQLARAQQGDLARVERRLLTLLQHDHPDAIPILEALSRGYMLNFRLEEALGCLQRWLAQRPNDVQALLWRGEVWERLYHREDALADYRRALELTPDRDDDRLHLAETLLAARQPDEAARHLTLLCERKPEDPKVLLNLARCRRLQGQADEARHLLERVIALAPEEPGAPAERGRLELEKNRPAEAEPWLRRAVTLMPAEKDVVYPLYQCLLRIGRQAEAEHYRQELDRIEAELDRLDAILRRVNGAPNDPSLRHDAGMIFLKNGQSREGLRWLASALQLDPLYAPTHAALADYYEKAGEPGQAAWHRELAHQRATRVAARGTPGN
jgi:predicted Zn-dependent protease